MNISIQVMDRSAVSVNRVNFPDFAFPDVTV